VKPRTARGDSAAIPARGPVGRDRIRRVGPAALVAASVAVGVWVVTVVNPEQPNHYPTCPFLLLTGYYCPACGSLRAVHALAHGDLVLAIHRNPLLVAAVPFLLWAYLRWTRRLALGLPSRTAPPWLVRGLLAVLVGFWVLRNVPALSWLAP